MTITWAKVKKYLFNLVVAADRDVNAILGGDPAMTVSGRMGKSVAEGKCSLCKWVCKALNVFQPNHCAVQAAREANLGADEVIK